MLLFALAAAKSGSDFLQKTINIGSFGMKVWHLIVAIVIIVALIAVLIVCIAKASKKGKRTKKTESIADTTALGEDKNAENQAEVIQTNGTAGSDYIRVSGRKMPELPADEPVEEEPEEKIEEEVPTVIERKEPVQEETKEEIVAEEIAAEEPKEEPKEEVKEAKKEAKPVKKEGKKKEEPKKAEKVESPETKVTGKFEICNSDLGGFNYLLRANNGQLLYESKEYKSKDSCKEAIDNFIVAVKDGRFAIRADKFKNYKFVLKSPTSNTLIYIGESFSTESSCKSNVESVKRFAVSSPVVDITKEDFVAKFVPYEIPDDVIKAVKEKSGAVGKWSIEQAEEGVKNSPYVFLLYANNGQLLFESRDYKTYSNCLSGLNTFVNTVKTGVFAIDPDKSGRFKFVLRSNSVNSAMEYYGQNYDTQKGCANSIESVYKFALLSPVPEK